MQTVKLTSNLWLHEYFDKELYFKYEARNQLWKLLNRLDPRLVKLDQFMRERYGVVTINNWLIGGVRNWSGFRSPESEDYSENSLHSWCMASDKLFRDKPASEVIDDILRNYKSIYKDLGLRGLEVRATWVHSDVRNCKELIKFTP